MERRSLLSMIFGSDRNTTAPATSEQIEVVEGYKAQFTPYRGNFHEDPDVLACVDKIARNGAKMHPRHIRNYFSKEENKEKKNGYYKTEEIEILLTNKNIVLKSRVKVVKELVNEVKQEN